MAGKRKKTQRYTNDDASTAATKVGQLIGEAFARATEKLIQAHLHERHPDYKLVRENKARRLRMTGGALLNIDTVITTKDSHHPVAILETKWLKDGRHHNDKGAWILKLREVGRSYSTVRGLVAILLGYWEGNVLVWLVSEGGVTPVLVATDEEVYGTLQPTLDAFMGNNSFKLDAGQIRDKFHRPGDLANLLIKLYNDEMLDDLAASWLQFERETDSSGSKLTGAELVCRAIDELLAPLPDDPHVEKLEISLRINTGNTIFETFDDLEDALEFLRLHYQNPKAILSRITPRQGTPPAAPDQD